MSEEEGSQKTRKGSAGSCRFAIAKKNRGGIRVGSDPIEINEQLQRDLAVVKKQSRKAGNDDSYIVKYLNMCETHIVGPEGFTLQNQAMVSGSNKERDKISNDIIEHHFKRWGKKGCCDVTGRYSWKDVQTIFIRTVAEDGEVLIRFVEGFDNEYGFAIQLLDSSHLDINYNRDLKDGNRIRMSVEVNGWGRVAAYHVRTQHPGDRVYYYGNVKYERIPVEEIWLSFVPFRLGQLRGVPWAHASLLEMYHMYGYREAELVGARGAASKMFAYVPDSEVVPEGDEEEADFVEELEPGSGIVAPYGYDIKTLDWSTSGSNFSAYMKEGKRGAASGLDVSYNSLANDGEGVSFGTLRQFVLDDRDSWKKKQRWAREELCDQVFSRFLRMGILKGAIPKLRFSDLSRLDNPLFQGRRWSWFDPLKDEKANTEAIENLTKSQYQIIRDRGDDPETVMDEILDFENRMSEVRLLRSKLVGVSVEVGDDGDEKEA